MYFNLYKNLIELNNLETFLMTFYLPTNTIINKDFTDFFIEFTINNNLNFEQNDFNSNFFINNVIIDKDFVGNDDVNKYDGDNVNNNYNNSDDNDNNDVNKDDRDNTNNDNNKNDNDNINKNNDYESKDNRMIFDNLNDFFINVDKFRS